MPVLDLMERLVPEIRPVKQAKPANALRARWVGTRRVLSGVYSLIANRSPVFGGKLENICPLRDSPVLTDSVEKVSKMKLWNQSLKQSNPSKWSFESMLLVRRSP
jgi:hypothetical protein